MTGNPADLLPSRWRMVPLKRVAALRSGDAIPSDDIHVSGDYPVYGGNGIRGYADRCNRDGDHVLVGRQGALCGNVTRARDRFWASEHAVVVTPRDNNDPGWLEFLLWSMNLGQHSQSAAQPGLSVELIGNLQAPVPPLPEQHAIADYLEAETSRIDALLEARRLQAELLVDHRRSVIDSFSVPAALGGRADMGAAWTIAKLKRAAAFFADGDWIESPFITTDGIRLIQTGNIGEGIYRDQGFRYISDETFQALDCTEVLPGDILISRLAGTVGRACLAPDLGARMVASVDVVIMRPVPDLDPDFAVAYLSSSYHLELAELLARGTTMPRLSRSQVAELPIPLPPLNVQRRVVGDIERRLASVDALSAALEKQIVRLMDHRQALITAAVTGQIEIPGVAA